MNGWIRLYRQLLESPIFENEKALKIWIWCLLKATHTDREQLVGLQVVKLEKGQFIFGRKKASEELNINENTIYKYIKMLEKLEMITTNSNTKFTIVSIRKWEEYQYISSEEITTEEQQNNNKVTTKEQQNNTNKNVKNDKNVKNVRNKKENIKEKIQDDKIHFAEFVSMTNVEYEKLVNTYGKSFADQCITVLDNYKGANGKKYKDDYRAILNWVVDKVKKNNIQKTNDTGNPFFDYLREEGKM